jgi:hypothetical protein
MILSDIRMDGIRDRKNRVLGRVARTEFSWGRSKRSNRINWRNGYTGSMPLPSVVGRVIYLSSVTRPNKEPIRPITIHPAAQCFDLTHITVIFRKKKYICPSSIYL